jgi:hypothetical protein
MDLDGGVIHSEGRLKGVGPEIKTFLGPEMATSAASAFWAQKSQDFKAHPFKHPEEWFPPSKSIGPAPYKQQVHW